MVTLLTIIALVCVAVLPLFFLLPCALHVSIVNPIESDDADAWAAALDSELAAPVKRKRAPRKVRKAPAVKALCPYIVADVPQLAAMCDNIPRARKHAKLHEKTARGSPSP